jgi:hypothetical protein
LFIIVECYFVSFFFVLFVTFFLAFPPPPLLGAVLAGLAVFEAGFDFGGYTFKFNNL